MLLAMLIILQMQYLGIVHSGPHTATRSMPPCLLTGAQITFLQFSNDILITDEIDVLITD